MESLTNEFLLQYMKLNGLQETCKYICNKNIIKTSKVTLLKDLERLNKKYQNLNKSKSRVKGKENLDRFLKKPYMLPAIKDSGDENINKSTNLFLACDSRNFKEQTFANVAETLVNELVEVKNENLTIREELDAIIEEKDTLNESLEEIESKLQNSKMKLKRTANREVYWREKCSKLNSDNDILCASDDTECLKTKIDRLQSELRTKSQLIDEMRENLLELETENRELKKIQNVNFYDEKSKSYDLRLHACVYSLLDNHVAYNNVNAVISAVLSLVSKKPNKLPSIATIHNWSIERSLIAKRQISETCLTKQNTTLHTDETSKFGMKWGAFATRDSEGNYTLLGLKDMATKSSHDTLDSFKDILEDIDGGNHILINIKNTMSDRAFTETKFNDLLRKYRDEILPEIIDHYHELSEEEKYSISRMNNFFCGLHTLVHMAETAQKSMFETEKLHFSDGDIPILNKSFEKSGQSGTGRLILTACKAFARRGDARNGCHGNFMTFLSDFLKENKMSFPLQPLKGNRFNILFTNAGQVYYFHNYMTDFLDRYPAKNGLLQSVKHDLSEPFFIAGCKALGLISKLITTPLWKVIEDKDISMKMMTERYERLLIYLQEISLNVEDFIEGKLTLFDDVPIKKDAIYNRLVERSDSDNYVIVILGIMLPSFTKLIKEQYKDHLPGGKNTNLSEIETASVDKHNKFPERVFSYVDFIISSKPNISAITMESHVTFSLNKTSEWLNQQENVMEIIKQCRKEVANEKAKFKQREELIRAKRLEKQNEEFRKKEEIERKRIEKLEKETNDMLYYGLWQSETQLNNALRKIETKKEKEEALRVQLRFRKNVFNQKCEQSVFSFSKVVDGKRIMLDVEELKRNVLVLINNSFHYPSPEVPHLLVGKTISHRFNEKNGGIKWYSGKVISQVPGFPAWFNVMYDDDEDIYSAKLGEEFAAGDVVIKV